MELRPQVACLPTDLTLASCNGHLWSSDKHFLVLHVGMLLTLHKEAFLIAVSHISPQASF